MAHRGVLKPLEPDDSISCVGEQGFKSTWLSRPELDNYYRRARANTLPARSLESTQTSHKSPSKRRNSVSSGKHKNVGTTTTYRSPDDAARYIGDFEATSPPRSDARKHSSARHSVILVEKEPSYTSSTTKGSSSRQLPPRSNDRFYDYHRAEPQVGRGRSSLIIPDRRSLSLPLRAYSQERGNSSGLNGSFWSLRAALPDTGSWSGNERRHRRSGGGASPDTGSWSGNERRHRRSGEGDDVRYESRRVSSVGSRSYVKMPEYESYGDRRSYLRRL